MFERTLKSKRIYKGRIIGLRDDIVRVSNGVISHREIVEHPGAVAIIAIKGGSIVLIRQFRKSAEQVLLEIPAGLMKKGEKPASAARRELIEETGFKAKRVRELFWGYSSPGYSTEIIRFFLATGLTKVGQNCDHDEMIDVEVVPMKMALQMVKSGKVKDNKTMVGILAVNKWKK